MIDINAGNLQALPGRPLESETSVASTSWDTASSVSILSTSPAGTTGTTFIGDEDEEEVEIQIPCSQASPKHDGSIAQNPGPSDAGGDFAPRKKLKTSKFVSTCTCVTFQQQQDACIILLQSKGM